MTMTGDQAGTRADEGNAAAFDEARRTFAAALGGFRRSPVLVPLDDRGGLWTTSYGGVWWIHAFSDEDSLADFARARDEPAGRQWDYVTVLGARLLDVVIPGMGEPAGIALDPGGAHPALFPPLKGVVPDSAAIDGYPHAHEEGAR
ncbi:SseB family protein [Streptomyces sp. QH1-20]|uniref:SseB family protein n=1 Tax=Streptomyces sp. QH1-20 TaxID=3240934 RepID=UPI003517E2CA